MLDCQEESVRLQRATQRSPDEVCFGCHSPLNTVLEQLISLTLPREPRLQLLSDLYTTYEGGGSLPIRLPDISLHETFVNTSTHFPEGAVVNLRFRLTRPNTEVQTLDEVHYCLVGIGIGIKSSESGLDRFTLLKGKSEPLSDHTSEGNDQGPADTHRNPPSIPSQSRHFRRIHDPAEHGKTTRSD